jgi:hypothetical protein
MKFFCGSEKKEIDLTIPPNKEKIGVMLSGGADSAILLFLLAKFFSHKKLIPLTVPRYDGAYLYAPSIVEHINQTLHLDISKPLKLGDPDLPHYEQAQSGIDIAFKYNIVDYVFWGTQSTPPPDLVQLSGLYPNRRINKDLERVSTPFFDLYKSHTLELYFQFDQIELLKLTHSCTEKQIGRCNQCFQCDERSWAFKCLGKEDPGQL